MTFGPAFATWLGARARKPQNRPLLRCLHGLGHCRWRLGDTTGAVAVFGELLGLDPADGQGARSELAAIEAGRTWQELEAAR